jgi:hypothetical protein
VNHKLETMLKGAVVAYFKLLSRKFPGGTDKNNKRPQDNRPSGLDSNSRVPKY